jgi:hypothetical protein
LPALPSHQSHPLIVVPVCYRTVIVRRCVHESLFLHSQHASRPQLCQYQYFHRRPQLYSVDSSRAGQLKQQIELILDTLTSASAVEDASAKIRHQMACVGWAAVQVPRWGELHAGGRRAVGIHERAIQGAGRHVMGSSAGAQDVQWLGDSGQHWACQHYICKSSALGCVGRKQCGCRRGLMCGV